MRQPLSIRRRGVHCPAPKYCYRRAPETAADVTVALATKQAYIGLQGGALLRLDLVDPASCDAILGPPPDVLQVDDRAHRRAQYVLVAGNPTQALRRPCPLRIPNFYMFTENTTSAPRFSRGRHNICPPAFLIRREGDARRSGRR